MKVKLLTSLSGPEYSLSPGEDYEFETDEAIRLIEAGYAKPANEEKAERAVKEVPAAVERRVKKEKDVVSTESNDTADE